MSYKNLIKFGLHSNKNLTSINRQINIKKYNLDNNTIEQMGGGRERYFIPSALYKQYGGDPSINVDENNNEVVYNESREGNIADDSKKAVVNVAKKTGKLLSSSKEKAKNLLKEAKEKREKTSNDMG